METPLKKSLQIVTAVGDDGKSILEERSVDNLLGVLWRRASRLVKDRETYEKLKPLFKDFIYNIVEYFRETDGLDEYVMTNIVTALATCDNHGDSDHGVEEFSTLIRRPNPADPDTYKYFVIGREGRINDPGCPLTEMATNDDRLAEMHSAQLHVFRAFHYARSMDTTRGAPRIPVEDQRLLIPSEIRNDSVLEEAFLDVCFSDGAWELYHIKKAA